MLAFKSNSIIRLPVDFQLLISFHLRHVEPPHNFLDKKRQKKHSEKITCFTAIMCNIATCFLFQLHIKSNFNRESVGDFSKKKRERENEKQNQRKANFTIAEGNVQPSTARQSYYCSLMVVCMSQNWRSERENLNRDKAPTSYTRNLYIKFFYFIIELN